MQTEHQKFPSILQIEPTTHCNFECEMCIHSCKFEDPKFFPMEEFIKLSTNLFPMLEKIVFMGIGEPLMNPNFVDMIQIARNKLPTNGEIEFTTNAQLLTPHTFDRIIDAGVTRIIISLDTPIYSKLKRIREGITEDIFTNIEYAAKKYKEGDLPSLYIESVLTQENLYDISDLVEYCYTLGLDHLIISHLLPHSTNMINQALYSLTSTENKAISDEIAIKGWELARKLMFDPHHFYRDSVKEIHKDIESYRKKGLDINPSGIFEDLKKTSILEETKKVFTHIKKLGKNKGIKLNLPPINPSLSNRFCPYISQNAIVINVDGEVVPCYNYIHEITNYVNYHSRTEKIVSFGNIKEKNFIDIWKSREYIKFREHLNDMKKTVPWCGDCPFSLTDCFFTQNNEADCWGNEPSCHECLYSMHLIKCLINENDFI